MQIQIINDLFTTPLSDLRAGQVGVDSQGNVYARVYVANPQQSQTQLFKLNDMGGQYNDHISAKIQVRVLDSDEKVVLTI